MNSRLLILAIVIALAGRAAWGEPLPDVSTGANLAPEEGLLLLKNGQTLKGRIARAGDRWFVWLPDGEIRVAAIDVDLFCRDVHEGYQRKRQTISPQRLYDRVQLAEWCLANQLLEEAKQETLAAASIDPQHPNVVYLQRRLELIASTPVPPPPLAMPDQPSGEDLDRFAKKLSPETVALFTQTIQPLLANRCGTGACHGAQGTSRWQLQRIPISGTPRQRLTQRNMLATFPFVASRDATNSPLYVHAGTAHGGAKQPTFGPRDQASLQQLAIWLQYAGRDAPGVQNLLPFHAADAAAPAAIGSTPSDAAAATIQPVANTTVAPASVPAAAPAANATAGGGKPNAPAQPDGAPFTPADPFDPEIFNRQFGAPQ